MNLGSINEDALVKRLLTGSPLGKRTVLGPGDDCAAIRQPGSKELLLLKTDCVVEGVHFLREHAPAQVGWKALCRALSDIAAMGGTPQSALITIFSPSDRPVAYWRNFYKGLNRAAERYQVGIVGGETSRASQVAVAITVTGGVPANQLLTRSGGQPGDRLFVTGKLGGSIKGHHLRFTPRMEEGSWLAREKLPSAMMDLSDGLGSDLPRLASASHCGYQVDLAAVPRNRGCDAKQAVSDGEDYELLLAVPERRCARLQESWARMFPSLPLTEIGQLTTEKKSGDLLPTGYEHFSVARHAKKRRS
jgi:thiamine-monophosphate kinase